MSTKVDHWANDRLGRKNDAEFLYNFLVGQYQKRLSQGRTASYVLNIDADWGGGKTFFLEGLAADIESRGHLVASINAWRDDHAQDPYVAIMAAIDNVFAPFIRKPGRISKAWSATKSSGGAIALRMTGAIAKGLLKKHTGVSPDELTDILADEGTFADIVATTVEEGSKVASDELEKLFDSSLEALIEGFQRTNQATTDFREKLQKAIATLSIKKKAPFFILVDELDRCRPTYAVQLLERVKHLFDVEGVVFVFATNSDQLRHSIAGAYGPGFDGFRYLKRFFERTYVFDKPSIENMVESLCADLPKAQLKAPEDNLTEAIALGCKAFDLDLRAVIQVVEMIDATATAWPHKLPADISLVLPACVHFYLSGKAEWPSTDLPALRRWTIERSSRRNFEGRTIDRSIKFGEIYAHATSIFRTMDQITNDTSQSQDSVTALYVSSLFLPEWNGISFNRDKPSIQTEILGIVANAGRMVATSDE